MKTKTIIQAMLEEIYEKSIKISHGGKQVFKDETRKDIDGSYFITLAQLETILKEFEG